MSTDHYTLLGLSRHCTEEQIRIAYRILAKQHHPDLNPGSKEAVARTQELNLAYETLSDPERRKAYDASLGPEKSTRRTPSTSRTRQPPIRQDITLRIDEFLRGTSLQVTVQDPGNPEGSETYTLEIPAETPPGARFRIQRTGTFAGSQVHVRVKARPDPRFKIRGSDLRCDLKIPAKRAAQGGWEQVRGASGKTIRLTIPAEIARGEELRIVGEGLPKGRGGRGDLLVRVMYTPEVRITRTKPTYGR